jgi:hypothetical protein
LKKKGSWSTRRVAVTAVFVLTIGFGAKQLLSGSSSPAAGVKARSAQAATMVVKAPGGVAVEKTLVRSSGPSEAALREAERLRGQGWDGADLFSGDSWGYSKEISLPEHTPAKGDTVLQATSYSSEGWRAVVGGRMLRVGDSLLGGKVVSISEGRVVVRGTGWEKVLGFSKTRGQ